MGWQCQDDINFLKELPGRCMEAQPTNFPGDFFVAEIFWQFRACFPIGRLTLLQFHKPYHNVKTTRLPIMTSKLEVN